MPTSSSTITARTQVAGLHQWPDAPDRRGYLRALHRHVFAVEAEVVVNHEERETEFHDLAEYVEGALLSLGSRYHDDSSLTSFGARSCETLAAMLVDRLEAIGQQVVRVTVSEDGENDATAWGQLPTLSTGPMRASHRGSL